MINGNIKSEPLSPTSSNAESVMNSPPYCQQFTLNPSYVQDVAQGNPKQLYHQYSNRGSIGSSGGTNSFPPSPTNSDMSSSSSDNFSTASNFIVNPKVICDERIITIGKLIFCLSISNCSYLLSNCYCIDDFFQRVFKVQRQP